MPMTSSNHEVNKKKKESVHKSEQALLVNFLHLLLPLNLVDYCIVIYGCCTEIEMKSGSTN